MKKCKCSQCGYLIAESGYIAIGGIPEIGNDGEVPGILRNDKEPSWGLYIPICFRQKQICEPGSDTKAKNLAVHSERNCDFFTPYYQGMSPKEHLQMEISNNQHKEAIIVGSRAAIWSAVIGFAGALIAGVIGGIATLAGAVLTYFLMK